MHSIITNNAALAAKIQAFVPNQKVELETDKPTTTTDKPATPAPVVKGKPATKPATKTLFQMLGINPETLASTELDGLKIDYEHSEFYENWIALTIRGFTSINILQLTTIGAKPNTFLASGWCFALAKFENIPCEGSLDLLHVVMKTGIEAKTGKLKA